MPPGSAALSTTPHTARPQARWSVRVALLVLVVFLVGSALSVFVFLDARNRMHNTRRVAFERQASQVAATLHTSFDLPLEVIRGIPALFDAAQEVDRAQFSVFARSVLRRHPSVYALEWIPLVPHEARQTVEQQASHHVPGFQFKEVGPNKAMLPASKRSEYLPILFMEPPNEVALGFDVASNATRRAPADRARDLGEAVASPRIRLVEDPVDVFSVAIFVPVFEGGGVPSTPTQRRDQLRGFGAEVFRVEPVVVRALEHVDLTGLDFVLADESAPEQLALLYESTPGLHSHPPDDSFQWSRSFPYAQRTWSLRFCSKPGSVGAATPWHVLIRGILISILAGVFIYATAMIIGLRRQVEVARKLGQYTLETRLGQGGMGVVYRAKHAMLRRPTAIKLLTGSNAKSMARFEREVQMTSRLTHPNTIAIYDYGRTPEGVFYYAMELLEGITLEELVEVDGPQPPARVLHILKQVCGALAEAHATGLIHRDIKPANVMLTRRGRIPDFVKVLDFGLVKDLQNRGVTSLSVEGALVGTPLYLAPEAITGPGQVNAATDLYAVGAVGYFLLTATPVFIGKSLVEVCGQHLHNEPVPPSKRIHQPIPEPIESLVLACLAKDPAKRPASADVLLGQIQACEHELGEWTLEQAESWWTEKAEKVLRVVRRTHEREERKRPAAPHTVAVDINRREKAQTPRSP